MLTYPKLTLRVLRMSMHWSSGHMTLLRGEFQPPKFFPQSDLSRRAGRTHVGLCPKFLVGAFLPNLATLVATAIAF